LKLSYHLAIELHLFNLNIYSLKVLK